MDVDKKELRKKFSAEWEKHYKIGVLLSQGFRRQKCRKCGRQFWSIRERGLCGDAACIGFEFIGKSPVENRLNYIETWKKIERYFTEHKHAYIKPYPTVARWRDDLYFTIASINDFQPYVVNGELEPPANPLVVPQPCIRFPDIQNVGVTGSHYTNFVMIGQHAFNTEKTGLFYWKDEALGHDIEYLSDLGIPLEEIVFQEDVWAGGGNFGPSMEYFVGGLELGNCVFMQYEVTPKGARELKTKVIDMGAGLSRLAWITSGDPTSYEVVFGDVIKQMKKDAGVAVDHSLLTKFSKFAGGLNIDEVEDIDKEKERVAKELGMGRKELFGKLEPLQALYASADHLLTILFTTTDGMLPSNAGGGYNLRMILRRTFGFADRYDLRLDYEKIIKGHAKHLNYLFPHLAEGVDTTMDVIAEEQKKYAATKEKARLVVANVIKNAKKTAAGPKKEREGIGEIGADELALLYKSHGIPPEYVTEIAAENGVEAKMPGNFYDRIRAGEGEEAKKEEEQKKVLFSEVVNYPKTEGLYYTDVGEFEANVLGVTNDGYVVLDRSAFYPEGGGQVADTGRIGAAEVTDVIKKAGVILHKVKQPEKLKKKEKVACRVDLERRKRITVHHTCAHILNAAARKVLGSHVWQAGSYKDEEKGHLDITHYRKITNEELDEIEKTANEYIRQDLPVRTEVLQRNEAEKKYGFRLYQGGAVPGKELRIVSIGDIDHEACGGTHHMITTTGEIGYYKIVKREGVQDGVERIVFKGGDAAIAYAQERERIIREASSAVSVSDAELVNTVKRFFEEWKMQGKKIEQMAEGIAGIEKKEITHEFSGTGKPVFRVADLDGEVLKKLAISVSEADRKIGFCIINAKGDAVCGCGEDSAFNANELLQKVMLQLGGKGGGSRRIAFGKVSKTGKVVL